MANRHGWRPSDERPAGRGGSQAVGVQHSSILRDSAAGRQAAHSLCGRYCCSFQSYKADVSAMAEHLQWPKAKSTSRCRLSEGLSRRNRGEISEEARFPTDWEALKHMLPQATRIGFATCVKELQMLLNSFWINILQQMVLRRRHRSMVTCMAESGRRGSSSGNYGLLLFGTGCDAWVDACNLRSKEGNPLLKAWAERGAKARRGDFCGRKDHLAIGSRGPRAILDHPLPQNRD